MTHSNYQHSETKHRVIIERNTLDRLKKGQKPSRRRTLLPTAYLGLYNATFSGVGDHELKLSDRIGEVDFCRCWTAEMEAFDSQPQTNREFGHISSDPIFEKTVNGGRRFGKFAR
jgi:hypothetical protein